METGTIKRLVREKGFGFIVPSVAGAELFFHRSALKNIEFDDLHEGERVSYVSAASDKGPRAENIQVLR